MYSRLLSAVLRLLPQSAYQSLDNPVQLGRLPDHSGVEFDYPVFQDSASAARRKTTVLLFLAALVAPLLVWGNVFIPIPIISGGMKTLVLLAGAGCLILGIVGNRAPTAAYGMAIFGIAILAMLVVDVRYTLAALFPALLGGWLFADRLATFFLQLKTAAPVPRDRATQARSLWSRRWHALGRSIRGSELFPLNFAIFVLPGFLVLDHMAHTTHPFMAFLINLNPDPTLPASVIEPDTEFFHIAKTCLFLTLAGLAWPVCLDLFIAPWYGRRPYGIRLLVSAFWHALVEWCTYNRLNTQGVGIHQSSAGFCNFRRQLLIGVVVVWACALAGAHPGIDRPRRLLEPMWQSLGLTDMAAAMKIHSNLIHELQTGSKPDGTVENEPDAKAPPLESYEEELLQRMSPERREQYLQQRMTLHRESAQRQRQEQKERRGTEGSASLIVSFISRLINAITNVLIPTLGVLAASLSLIFAASARALAGSEDLFGRKLRERVLSTDNWEMLVERLRSSQDKIECTSLFFGTNARDDTPVIIPREVFGEHAHILGDSGSGKTSLGLMPLISQLMRFGDCSVIVIDLKADDQALFETLRIEAANIEGRLQKKNSSSRYPVRWFTTELDRSSYVFNPLTQRVMPQLADYQRTDIITAALGLQYGNDYGRKFFGDANYDLLNYAVQNNPQLDSFAGLAEILQGADRFPLERETKRAATHVRSSIRRLARCEPLNGSRAGGTPAGALGQAIDFADLFQQPQAVYFALPPSSGISNTAEIARIAVYSLLAAAQLHKGRRTPVFLIIDEFQRIVSNNLALFLQTARSMDIGVVLSNQSLEDLDSVDANLIPAVRTNTRFRQVFATGNRKDIQDLRDTAGETYVGYRSWEMLPSLFSEGWTGKVNIRETPVSRLMLNDILLATDAFGRNIACLRRGAGYAQYGGMPFIMDSVHHISKKTYDERQHAPWPEPNEGTIVAVRSTPPSAPPGETGRVLNRPTPLKPDDSEDGDPPDEAFGPDPLGTGTGITDPLALILQEQQDRNEQRRKRRRRDEAESPDNPQSPAEGAPPP